MTVDIKTLLERGVVDVIVRKDLEQKLKSGKKLRVKLGIDPSGADLHIGHMVVIKKLEEFRKAGHHITLLFGNFTGQIGDPTDKLNARKPKTQKELEKNAKKYIEQAGKILGKENVEIRWNADWLGKLTFADVINLAQSFTVQQMLERDMYQERIKKAQPIYMHEFLYPLMQGYDSVALKTDLELGGTDQTFNLLAGRPIQKAHGQEPQNILTVPLLVGTDGKDKMGKSLDNYIGVNDTPRDMFGKTMSIPDNLILSYFELATNLSLEDIKEIEKAIKAGENPIHFKKQLGRELVSMYHNAEAAEIAEKEFAEIFKKKGIPMRIPLKKLEGIQWNIVDLLAETGIVTSKSEARRLVQGNAVKILPKITVPKGMKIVVKEAPKPRVLNRIDEKLDISQEQMLKIGKRHFIRVIGK